MGEDPSHLLVLLGNLPCCAHGLVATEEKLVKSLTSDDLELSSPCSDFAVFPEVFVAKESSSLETEPSTTEAKLFPHDSAPKHTPWLLGSLILMGLDSYLLQLSPMSSLSTPLRAAIPVLHWMVYWWIYPGMRARISQFSSPLLHGAYFIVEKVCKYWFKI
ncbi:hypothetical protein DSO57_1033955 [Entomophthora muscae]|uniref:Uncharacterized protein n=1 Tax=Entomophthora muscae TaxID=34485 RepID=A0ACC2TB85_9FUNG|nr:hypothetical protein DSO57_1033955 [Entomophthora muscae]